MTAIFRGSKNDDPPEDATPPRFSGRWAGLAAGDLDLESDRLDRR